MFTIKKNDTNYILLATVGNYANLNVKNTSNPINNIIKHNKK